eukprot:Phypoly_transcript_01337.p1 GENE.Phypoly_transcript_01337~~Phypoly_transcript_01337.p1  ORF type:complete len:980 (+),score=177.96 Phypoly_transcript_01337:113-3052(+)
MSITLKVQYGTDQKVVKYATNTQVNEVLANCIKKFRISSTDDHAILLTASSIRPTGKWLNNDKTLQEEGILNNDILEFRNKRAMLRIKLTDGTTKTLQVNIALPTADVCKFIGDKILIKNGEEFGLQIEKTNDTTHKTEVVWLDPNRTLGDQGVTEDSHLIYKKKFFVDDDFISTDDPASIHLLYLEAHTAIVAGSYPCSLQEAILFAAFQCQFELRNYNPDQHHEGTLKLDKMLPPAYAKTKNVEQSIFKEHKKLAGMTEVNAKFRYVQLCRSLKTYGMSVFKIQMAKHSNSKKMVDKYLGITKQGLFLLDGKNKSIEKEYPLDHLRRWSHTESTLTLDFGTYEDDYLNCNTTDGEAINNLISGYIDLIMKKLQTSAANAAEASGTADLNADLSDRPGLKRGTVNTSEFARADDDLFTTARRLGRPNVGGSQPAMAQELSAAILNINRMIEEAEKMQADGSFDGGNQTDEIPEELRAQFAATIQAVNATMAKLLEPLSKSFVNGTPLSAEEISETHRIYAPQVVALVESILALAKNPLLPPKARAVMLAAAKSIASTMSNFLLATQEAAANPDDSVARENVYEYAQKVSPSLTLLETLSHGTDFGGDAEIMELVKKTSQSATSLQAAIAQALERFESPVIKAQVQLLAAQLAGYDSHMRELVQTLAPYLNDPVVKKSVHDTLKIYSANLSHLAKCALFESETGPGAEAITTAINNLKGHLNGLCVHAVGSEIEPKVEPPPPTPEVPDDEKMVQDELEAATRAIRELSEALRLTQQQNRKHTVDPTELANQELSEGILDATKSIAMASEKLMLVAVALQKELVIAGRAAKAANQYKRDPAWAQGLISASQTVTFTIRQLVESAQACSRGENYDEERLRVLATNVNAAAIRLVTAAKVKAPPNSQYVGQLGEAHKDVSSATNLLVERAKRPAQPTLYSEKYGEMTPTQKAIREVEVQTKILKLQKALEDAQVELGNLRSN